VPEMRDLRGDDGVLVRRADELVSASKFCAVLFFCRHMPRA
jgi:hypothetical protein